MKICFQEAHYIRWSLVRLIFLIYILSLAVIPEGSRPVTSQFFILATYGKYPNLDLIMKIESRCLKLCYEFRVFVRSMKAAFYRLHYQNFLMCRLIKMSGRAFVSKHAVSSLKSSTKPLNHLAQLLKHLTQVQRV